MHVKTSVLLFFLLTHTFITNQDCFGKTDDKSSKNSSSKCPVCLDVDMDNFCANMCVCVCVCVLGMDGIKSQGGYLRRGTWGLEFGKAFVGVTQHIVPRASDNDVYLPTPAQPGQHNSTHPTSIRIKFTHDY